MSTPYEEMPSVIDPSPPGRTPMDGFAAPTSSPTHDDMEDMKDRELKITESWELEPQFLACCKSPMVWDEKASRYTCNRCSAYIAVKPSNYRICDLCEFPVLIDLLEIRGVGDETQEWCETCLSKEWPVLATVVENAP